MRKQEAGQHDMGVTRSIQTKLVSILVTCAFVFIFVSAPILGYISFTDAKESARKQQARLVGAVAMSASIAAYVGNDEIADDVIDGLLLDDEILHVRLEGGDGFLIESGAPIFEGGLENATPTEYVLASPLQGEEQVGSLYIWSNDELITGRAFSSVKEDIAWLIVLSLMFSLVSIATANKLVGAPLQDLAKKLTLTKPGSDQQIDVGAAHQRDEIGLVANSVNSFLEVTRDALDAERNLRLQIERLDRHYQNIFASTNVGIMVLDENGVLLHSNTVLLDRIMPLTPSAQDRLVAEPFFEVAIRNPSEAWKLVAKARRQGETVSADLEVASGSGAEKRWVHCLVSGAAGNNGGRQLIEAVVYDVTSRIEEASRVKKMAVEDPLTGLKNRRGCHQFFEDRSGNGSGKTELAAMLMDLDGFKSVNDSLGHAAGDRLLQIIAGRLQGCVRSDVDLVGRFGGDEFVVIVELGARPRDAVSRIAENIIQQVSCPVNLEGFDPVMVGVSIGIAYSNQFDEFEELIDAADKAMYRVKVAGKNHYSFAPATC